jgi:CelD/BcsL family acetyltransferase involved in cellulose biosynthesis
MYTVTPESFDTLTTLRDASTELRWNSVFSLPAWMKVWWEHFGGSAVQYLVAVRDGGRPIGVAPLKIEGRTASLLGSDNVCDYLDFVTAPGREEDFFGVLLDDLERRNVTRLDLGLLRPDATVLTGLAGVARRRGSAVTVTQEDVSAEMDLPGTFEDYLGTLNTKQRHEVRRKLRRLEEAGTTEYRLLDGETDLDTSLDTFVRLFSLARREDKASFMTPEMEAFFRSLAHTMARAGLLRLGRLDFGGNPVAMVLCFDYNETIYLYNSGFDPQHDSLSVGLLSKVFCIRDSIQQGRKRFEFLKGNEVYKQRLGGKEIPLCRCQITAA